MRTANQRSPRILIVTPEIASLPPGMLPAGSSLGAKAGGMADVTAGLVTALFDLGADVHVALPHYRQLFRLDAQALEGEALRRYKAKLPGRRLHLAEDSIFYYRTSVYSNVAVENPKGALRFQREIVNHIVPEVQPDLIHCNDWMTGLIPAMARRLGIPCLFTVHNIHTYELLLSAVEESGLDPEEFWTHLFFTRFPESYARARATIPIDLLASGIFASHFVNTVSPTFLNEIASGCHPFVPVHVASEFRNKVNAGCAEGILNAPPDSFDPGADPLITGPLTPADQCSVKAANKRELQTELGLAVDGSAPLFFWPSRLDPAQKGCELLAEILYNTISDYWEHGLQVAAVADGPYQDRLRGICGQHNLHERLAVRSFDERLSHLGYAAADFVLMPSKFEPCGLSQMIGAKYGALPVVHDTGGLHDTVSHLDVAGGRGNGFVFEGYDAAGLRWAIDQAMVFHALSPEVREKVVTRVMTESAERFSHAATAEKYFELYERMLQRPLTN